MSAVTGNKVREAGFLKHDKKVVVSFYRSFIISIIWISGSQGGYTTNDDASSANGDVGNVKESSSGILERLRANRAQLLDDFANGHASGGAATTDDDETTSSAAVGHVGAATTSEAPASSAAQPVNNTDDDDYVVLSD